MQNLVKTTQYEEDLQAPVEFNRFGMIIKVMIVK